MTKRGQKISEIDKKVRHISLVTVNCREEFGNSFYEYHPNSLICSTALADKSTRGLCSGDSGGNIINKIFPVNYNINILGFFSIYRWSNDPRKRWSSIWYKYRNETQHLSIIHQYATLLWLDLGNNCTRSAEMPITKNNFFSINLLPNLLGCLRSVEHIH